MLQFNKDATLKHITLTWVDQYLFYPLDAENQIG